MNTVTEALDGETPDWPVSESAMRWSPPVPRQPEKENGE